MRKKQLTNTPGVKNWDGMNILNSLMYYKEALKREKNQEKREMLEKRLNELSFELKNCKVA